MAVAAAAINAGAAHAATLQGQKVGPLPFTEVAGLGADSTGSIWFTDRRSTRVARLDVRNGSVRKFSGLRKPPVFGIDLIRDRRGNLWTPMRGTAQLARISPKGRITNLTTGLSNPLFLGPGVDKAIWYTDNQSVGRLDLSGRATQLATPSGVPVRPTPGRDGREWFVLLHGEELLGDALVAVTPPGKATEYPARLRYANALVTGRTGAVWVLRQDPGALFAVGPSGDLRRLATLPGEPIVPTAAADGSVWVILADFRHVAHVSASGRATVLTATKPVVRFLRAGSNMYFTTRDGVYRIR